VKCCVEGWRSEMSTGRKAVDVKINREARND
jgi:hypothetical protein